MGRGKQEKEGVVKRSQVNKVRKRKGKARYLTNEERAQVLKLRETGISFGLLAAKFSVSKTAIIRLCQQNDTELVKSLEGVSKYTKKLSSKAYINRSPKFPALEEAVYAWVVYHRTQGFEPTEADRRRQAQVLALSQGISEGEFKASRGWFKSFCGRHPKTEG
eukprot:comp23301_c1_seq1/m.38257 comp23301_c1_seq1/g.38257  ORF comp23301_c1_seq1/g.38257 comp23301_c1_seq1/m.38257 type:complete len:163 (-) comp23301_c1_seq1:576-1064(-)